MDWTTSKLNHSNQQMPPESSILNSVLGLAMIHGLKIIHKSSEHYTTRRFSNVTSSFPHIANVRAPQFHTGVPCCVRKSPKIEHDKYTQLMVGYTRSASCWVDDCASHMCIQEYSLDQVFGRSACLAAASHNW